MKTADKFKLTAPPQARHMHVDVLRQFTLAHIAGNQTAAVRQHERHSSNDCACWTDPVWQLRMLIIRPYGKEYGKGSFSVPMHAGPCERCASLLLQFFSTRPEGGVFKAGTAVRAILYRDGNRPFATYLRQLGKFEMPSVSEIAIALETPAPA